MTIRLQTKTPKKSENERATSPDIVDPDGKWPARVWRTTNSDRNILKTLP